jgi:hypothetical protein
LYEGEKGGCVTVNETIVKAIREKHPIRGVRDGLERFTCPYRIGWSRKNDYNFIHYQFGGHSDSGLEADGSSNNWRCHRVSSYTEVEIIDGSWHEPTVKPKTRGHCVITVEAEVDY